MHAHTLENRTTGAWCARRNRGGNEPRAVSPQHGGALDDAEGSNPNGSPRQSGDKTDTLLLVRR